MDPQWRRINPAPVFVLDEKQEWKTFSPGLDRVRAALKKLNMPHMAYPHILVGGTNGKGTVSSNLAANGPGRVGLFTSPHLTDVRERITINGNWLPDASWEKAFFTIQDADNLNLSYFEWLFLIAVVMFQQHEVTIAVFEVGLGGRLDATNALDPFLSILTNVSLDHTAILGNSVEEIALEKVEISRNNKTMILPYSIANIPCIAKRLEQIGSNISTYQDVGTIEDNWTLLDKCYQILDWSHSIKRVLPRGRQQKISPNVFVDGAHNQASWLGSVKWLKEEGIEKINILASLSLGRDPKEFLDIFAEITDQVYVWPLGFEKELPMEAWPSTVSIIEDTDLQGLIKKPLLVCGSLYVIGPFLSWYENLNLLNQAR